MTIHVNIGEAEKRLSQLVAAAVNGEDVVLDEAGQPQVRLVPVRPKTEASEAEIDSLLAKRRASIGMWKHLVPDVDVIVLPSMTDEHMEERFRRKFGPPA